ncbi:hypothetical protein C8J57DRAFT_1322764 [Mycena rebaudengoi]|nr:hypothetical protein C8J57DRAFT_1322764 [Mycena rebaudengoi]
MAIAALIQFWEPFSRELGATPLLFTLAIKHTQHAFETYRAGNRCIVEASESGLWSGLWSCGERFFPSLRSMPRDPVIQFLKPIYPQLRLIATLLQPHYPTLGVFFNNCQSWFELIVGLEPIFQDHVGALELSNFVDTGGHMGAFVGMQQILNQNKCMNVGCPALPGAQTRACARCAIVRYCGSECQKTAWRGNRDYPHKPLCDAIYSMREVLQLQDAEGWSDWVKYYTDKNPCGMLTTERKTEFLEMCLAKGVDPVQSNNISDRIQALVALCSQPHYGQ